MGMRLVKTTGVLAALLALASPASAECRVPALPLCAGCAPVLEIVVKRDGTCRVTYRQDARPAVESPALLLAAPTPAVNLSVNVKIEPGPASRPVRTGARRVSRRTAEPIASGACFTYNGNRYCE